MNMSINNDYFYELSNKDPEDVCRLALCTYNAKMKCYILPIWGEDYAIYPHEGKIIWLKNDTLVLDEFLGVLIAHYLVNAKESAIKKEWVSGKDILGGPIFFRGMHTIPTHFIAEKYENDFQIFHNVCQQRHGISTNMADAAYSFLIAPRIPVLVQFWNKDDEFMAQCNMLFDKSIADHLALEAIFGLSVVVCRGIIKGVCNTG